MRSPAVQVRKREKRVGPNKLGWLTVVCGAGGGNRFFGQRREASSCDEAGLNGPLGGGLVGLVEYRLWEQSR